MFFENFAEDISKDITPFPIQRHRKVIRDEAKKNCSCDLCWNGGVRLRGRLLAGDNTAGRDCGADPGGGRAAEGFPIFRHFSFRGLPVCGFRKTRPVGTNTRRDSGFRPTRKSLFLRPYDERAMAVGEDLSSVDLSG